MHLYPYLKAVCDEDVLDAAIDVLAERGLELDDGIELPFDADWESEDDEYCEAAREIEDKWDGIQNDVVAVIWDRADAETRTDLWREDAGADDPEDPVDAEGVWDLMRAAVLERCGRIYQHASMAEACIDALRVTSPTALARVLTVLECNRVADAVAWGRRSKMRAFTVEDGCVVVRAGDGGAVRDRLWPAFGEVEQPDGARVVEILADARREVGL
jgi:antitoxin component of RelBE/YafQ-DinJ toxin-antitoxin module